MGIKKQKCCGYNFVQCTYSGERIPLLGHIDVPVQYEKQNVTLPLVIVKGKRPALLGRNWLEKIQLDWPNIFTVEKAEVASDPAVKAELRQHTEVFSDKPSAINDFKATFRVLMQHRSFRKLGLFLILYEKQWKRNWIDWKEQA